ncbi:MAG: KTSC domain-containing protein [Caulobacteraceae bacterium]|nr:KTSC domain-containing protein [Caulobacter sp.]
MDSSAIAALAYDAAARRLSIRFRSGQAYGYAEVAPSVFAAFLAADSKGRFFHAEIDGRYAYRRLS